MKQEKRYIKKAIKNGLTEDQANDVLNELKERYGDKLDLKEQLKYCNEYYWETLKAIFSLSFALKEHGEYINAIHQTKRKEK